MTQRAVPVQIPAFESRPDPRSEEQVAQLADHWVKQRVERFGFDNTSGLSLVMRGDPALYRAIMAKLENWA